MQAVPLIEDCAVLFGCNEGCHCSVESYHVLQEANIAEAGPNGPSAWCCSLDADIPLLLTVEEEEQYLERSLKAAANSCADLVPCPQPTCEGVAVAGRGECSLSALCPTVNSRRHRGSPESESVVNAGLSRIALCDTLFWPQHLIGTHSSTSADVHRFSFLCRASAVMRASLTNVTEHPGPELTDSMVLSHQRREILSKLCAACRG